MSGTLSAGGHTSVDQSMKDYDDVDEDIDDGDVVEDMKDDDTPNYASLGAAGNSSVSLAATQPLPKSMPIKPLLQQHRVSPHPSHQPSCRSQRRRRIPRIPNHQNRRPQFHPLKVPLPPFIQRRPPMPTRHRIQAARIARHERQCRHVSHKLRPRRQRIVRR